MQWRQASRPASEGFQFGETMMLNVHYAGPAELALTTMGKSFRLAGERLMMAKSFANRVPDYTTQKGPLIPPDLGAKGMVISARS